MKKNLPVSQKEIELHAASSIISTTDPKGAITYVNREFIEISGFTEAELIGQSHNIVRHPDMPPAVFADLWSTLKSGSPWRGMVKNRCKNGDHYWVDAFVTPIMEKGSVIGYQSVRSVASREQIAEAEAQYQRLNANPKARLRRPFRLNDIGIMKRLAVMLALIAFMPALGDSLWAAGLIGDTAMVALAIATPVLMAITGFYIYRSMFMPMRKVCTELNRMAAGNLNCKLNYPYNDELGHLYQAVKMLQSRFRTIVGRMSEISIDLSTTAQQVSNSSTETFQVMLEQQQNTARVNESMQHVRSLVENVASHTHDAVEVAGNAANAATAGKSKISHLRGTIENLVAEVEDSARVITELDSRSQDISSILEVIRSIADQTNLLALNAAIEAARAGEQGRGFAVVADEVRTLAGRTAEATAEINSVIELLQKEIGSAVQVMQRGQQTAGEATNQSSEALDSMEQMSLAMVQMTAMNAQIAQTADEQHLASEQISADMAGITAMAGNTLAITQNNSEAGNNLTSVSEQMLNQFKRFGLVDNLDQQIAEARQRHQEQQQAKAASASPDDDVLF